MSDCQHFEGLILRLDGGDTEAIAPDDRAALHAHCRDCTACGSLLVLHQELLQAESSIPEPSDADLQRLSSSVMSRVARPAAAFGGSFWPDLVSLFRLHPLAVAQLVAVMLVVAAISGRWTVDPQVRLDDQAFLAELDRQAAGSLDVNEYLDGPLTYTNVAVHTVGTERVSLSFNICRRVSLQTDLASPLTREVLLAMIVDSPSPGARLRAMQLLARSGAAHLRDVVVFALHGDPDLAVRLEALAVLQQHEQDPAVQDALLAALRADPSVQVRLTALEHLVDLQVDPEIIFNTIHVVDLDGDAAVMQRAAHLQERDI